MNEVVFDAARDVGDSALVANLSGVPMATTLFRRAVRNEE